MSENEFRPIVIALVIFGLFAVALINVGILTANNNEGQSIGDSPALVDYKDEMQSNLELTGDQANSASEAFSNSSITLTSGFAYVDAIGGLWKAIYTIPKAVLSLTFGLLMMLGQNQMVLVLGVAGAIVTITIIFAVWKLISQGESG